MNVKDIELNRENKSTAQIKMSFSFSFEISEINKKGNIRSCKFHEGGSGTDPGPDPGPNPGSVLVPVPGLDPGSVQGPVPGTDPEPTMALLLVLHVRR